MYKACANLLFFIVLLFAIGCSGGSVKDTDYYSDNNASIIDNTSNNDNVEQFGCISGDCSNGEGTYVWKNGDRYEGGWANDVCNGYGTYYYKSDGSKYEGQWSYHNRVGQGTLWFGNGDVYTGEFKRNVPSGKGKYTYADGTVEEGEFLQYMFVGVIKLPGLQESDKVEVSKVEEVRTSSFEVVIRGSELKMGDKLFVEINGIMAALEVTYPMQTVARCKMIGQTKVYIFKVKKGMPVYRLMAGIKKGSNEFLFPNGNKYVGEYKGNLMNGKGEFYWTNGNVYNGDFKNGVRHGKGVINFYYGCVYDGDWKLGKFDGKGRYTWSDGSYYEGDWKGGWKNGKGSYHWTNGDYYVGDWSDDLMAGYGVYYYQNGDRYEGQWANDYMNGNGVLYDSAGNVKQKGTWKDGYYSGE